MEPRDPPKNGSFSSTSSSETIEAPIQRTGKEYEQVITGVGAEGAGDVDHETEAVLHVYVHGWEGSAEALMWGKRALDRIADDHDMDLSDVKCEV